MKRARCAAAVTALSLLSPLAAEAGISDLYLYFAQTNGVLAAEEFATITGNSRLDTSPASGNTNVLVRAQPPKALAIDKWELLSTTTFQLVREFVLDPPAYDLMLKASDSPFANNTTIATYRIRPVYSWLKYRISYDSNGATGTATDPELHIYTNMVALAQVNSLNRTGYTFKGWGGSASAASLRQPGDIVTGEDLGATTSGVVKLYANWTPITYQIQFSKGDGASGTMPNMVLQYDVATNLAKCAYSRAGHTFNGWKATVGGTVRTYGDEESVLNLASEQNALLEFEAQWRENSYNVRFNANGGSGEMPEQGFAYTEEKQLSSCAFTRVGYAFSKWTTESDGSGASYTNGQSVSRLVSEDGGAVDLYAQWTPISYAVAYAANGGEGEMASAECTYDAPFELASNAFSRVGYVFQSWTNATGEAFADGATVSNLTTVAASTQTLYAAWSPITYAIDYRPNAPDAYPVPPESMPDDTATFDEPFPLRANSFAREGHAFVEWNTESNGLGTAYADVASVLNLASNQNDVVDLWAQWTPVVYSVCFDPNGGEGSMDDMTGLVYGTEYTLASNKFTNGLRVFDGWAYTGGSLADGAKFSNLTNENGAVVTLSARWKSDDAELRGALDLDPDDSTLALGASLWTVGGDVGATNGTCLVSTSSDNDNSVLTMETQSAGTLRFRWKEAENAYDDNNHSFGLTVRYSGSAGGTNFVYSAPQKELPDPGWHDAEVAVTNSPATLKWIFSPNYDDGVSALLDCFVWTPDGGAEPTEADRPAISTFTATAGGFRLCADNVSDGFSYQILATNELVNGDWPVKETLTGAELEGGYDIAVEDGEPKMFYKVKVIRKQ